MLSCVLLFASLQSLAGVAQAFGHYDARNGAECRIQVTTHYDALDAADRARGNAASSWRFRAEDMHDCEQMDVRLYNQTLPPAWRRLDQALQTLRRPARLEANVQRALERDHATVLKLPKLPANFSGSYLDSYLKLWEQYQRYTGMADAALTPGHIYRCTGSDGKVAFGEQPCASGAQQKVQATTLNPELDKVSCGELQKSIASIEHRHDAAVAELVASHASGGNTNWRAAEAQRVSALNELVLQRDRARLTGCASQ